jgi:hypothetical protein
MDERFQQCFDQWRQVQPEGEPTLRQENAYRDGFQDALRVLGHGACAPVEAGTEVPAGIEEGR